jgi:chemotaxis response regulator CheB
VKEVYGGAPAEAGVVWLAPGDMHMDVGLNREVRGAGGESQRQVQVCLRRGQPMNYCRPSVDYLFNSAAQVYGAGTLAVVMTGMAADGLVGARSVHEAGRTVLTQDEASSVVWGDAGAGDGDGDCQRDAAAYVAGRRVGATGVEGDVRDGQREGWMRGRVLLCGLRAERCCARVAEWDGGWRR